MVRVTAAEPLMHLFANTLGLPISWPLQQSDFATYGWVTVGNTNLEFWASANNDDLPNMVELPLFHGFALDPPSLASSIVTLANRGVVCKPPKSFVTKNMNGRDVTNFTNSVILDVSSASCCIFFCEWCIDGTIFPWADKLTSSERQLREQKQLSASSGGDLGITGLVEIEMSVPSVDEAKATWQAITEQDTDIIHLGRGVMLNLIAGKDQKIESIVLGVRSLAAARAFLVDKNLIGDEATNEISLSQHACSNLRFRFRESDTL